MTKKFDVQLAVAATEAQGTQSAESQQVLAQRHLAFHVSAVPAVGSLAVFGRTPGAQDWSLITTIDMTLGNQLVPMMGLFDQFKCVPTGFDAGKSYWLTVTTADSGMFANPFPKTVTRSTIATGITATKNVNIVSHNMLGQHQLQVDCKGTAAGSVAVFGKPLNGALVPLGTIQLASGPRHILFRGFYDGLQFVPTGIGAAKLSVTLVSVEDGLLGPDLEMLMPMSTGLLADGEFVVYSAAKGGFVAKGADGFYAILSAATQSIPNNSTPVTALKWATPIYDTRGFFTGAAPQTSITVPYGVTKMVFKCAAPWANNAAGFVQVSLFKNGVNTGISMALPNSNLGPTCLLVSPALQTVAGDVWSIEACQTSGGALTVINSAAYQTFFSGEVIQ